MKVAITELDIRMTLPSNQTLLEQQKNDYTTAVSQCNSVRGCVGVTLWDFTDKVRIVFNKLNIKNKLIYPNEVFLGPWCILWSRRCLSLGRGAFFFCARHLMDSDDLRSF